MRTTLTLDEDVAAKIKALTRKTGRSFRDLVNDALRRGLAATTSLAARAPFHVKARDLGAVQPGVQLDDVGGLLDRIEGPLHR